MSGPSRQNTPDPGAGTRYRRTPAAPGGGPDQPTPATTTEREVPRCPPADPTGHPQPQPPPSPPAEPGGQPDPRDPLELLPEVLTVREVAAVLRIGRNQLYEAVARGEVRAVRIGRTIRIPKTTLLALLTAPPDPRAPAASPK